MRALDARYGRSQGISIALTILASIQGCIAVPYDHLSSYPDVELYKRQEAVNTSTFVLKTLRYYKDPHQAERDMPECYRMRFDSNRGPQLIDLHNWLYSDDNKYRMMPYIIDQVGCYQVACLGDRGKIQLCNNHPAPSYMQFTSTAIYEAVQMLATTFRTMEKHLYWVENDPKGYPPDYWRPLVIDGSCSDRWMEENEPKAMNDRVWGAFNGDGWSVQIDQPAGEAACNASRNFVTGDCRWMNPKICSWPYDTEIELVY
ncbi:hypothetical protein TWF696_005820 [Orbilia brochopaga]|uniref:C-type lectin domain-containing protein n=1 Tax=Orbilia brochopaga TaxID=3140254 RepID=A0AAV9UXN6_9PEZI